MSTTSVSSTEIQSGSSKSSSASHKATEVGVKGVFETEFKLEVNSQNIENDKKTQLSKTTKTTTTTSSISLSSLSHAHSHIQKGIWKLWIQGSGRFKSIQQEKPTNHVSPRKTPSSIYKRRHSTEQKPQAAPRKVFVSSLKVEKLTYIPAEPAEVFSRLCKEYGIGRLCYAFLSNEMRKNVKKDSKVLSFKPAPTDIRGIIYSQEEVPCKPADYMNRWELYGGCDEVTLLHTLVYIRRVQTRDSKMSIVPATVHRLFAGSVPIASKYIQDAVFPMPYYRRIAGIPTIAEMLRLELAILQFIGFSLYVSPEELSDLVYEIESIVKEDKENQYGKEHNEKLL